MKIALIIFRIGPSHGSILQSYALYKTLESLGHEVTIINRQSNFSIFRILRHILGRIKGKLLKTYYGPIFYTNDYPSISMKELNSFIEKYISEKTITIHTNKDLKEIIKIDYDCYIVGSDQTWRPAYVYDVRYYFLNFLPENNTVKRIAYAPSFGTDKWEYSFKLTKECKKYLSNFSAISVREKEGVELCKKYFNVKATHVLDPTMLLPRDIYIDFINKQDYGNDNILAFSILDSSELTTMILQRVSTTLNLKISQINASHNKSNNSWIEPGIEKWLEGIYKSKFIVTDSFHATVFAIIFNKPFITIINTKRGSSRINSLLSMFDLEDRMISSLEEISDKILFSPIEWASVNKVLEFEKERSIKWLNNVILK